MPLLEEALIYLVANTTNLKAPTSTGTKVPVYIGHLPPEVPDVALGMYAPGGAPPLAKLAGTVPFVERPRIQVISRAPTYVVAASNAQHVWDAFFKLANVNVAKSVGSTAVTFWASAEPVGSPADIGKDALERDQISVDFQIVKEMS